MEYGYWYFLRKYMSKDFQMMDLYAAGFPLVPEAYFATPLGSDPRETARCRKLNTYLPKMNENYKKLYDKPPFKDFAPDIILHCKAPAAGTLPIDPDGVLRYKNRAYKLVWTSVQKDARVQNDVYMPVDKVPADLKVFEYPAPTPSPAPTPTPSAAATN